MFVNPRPLIFCKIRTFPLPFAPSGFLTFFFCFTPASESESLITATEDTGFFCARYQPTSRFASLPAILTFPFPFASAFLTLFFGLTSETSSPDWVMTLVFFLAGGRGDASLSCSDRDQRLFGMNVETSVPPIHAVF